jgi:carbamoyltransferase
VCRRTAGVCQIWPVLSGNSENRWDEVYRRGSICFHETLAAIARCPPRHQPTVLNAVRILGIVTRTHDSGLALLDHGFPTLVLEEERFNREKHTRKFPFHSLKAAFDDRDLGLADIDLITTPWHMKSLWRMMFGAVRDGFPASLSLIPPSARPTQSTLILTMPMGLRARLLWHFGVRSKLPKIVQVRHHDAHAASFFVSPFEEATIPCDGWLR